MKKQTTFCLIILLHILLIFSCSSEENPIITIATGSDGLIPLKVGNSWTYQSTIYDLDSNITFQGTYLQEVFASVVSENLTWYYIDREPEANQYPRYTNKEDGYYEKEYETDKVELKFKYPCSEGDSYLYGDHYINVLSTDTIITTTRGDFKCILYRLQFLDPGFPGLRYHIAEWFISPEIGIIRYYSYSPSYGGLLWELLSYILN
ncbi:MAG: hypothetical protein HKM87_05650 [Ignavibacteriaceae bacterium]|nr:hypothetical protein [Ignavibacteriaceae bacterium]